jgi:hypothetical protein
MLRLAAAFVAATAGLTLSTVLAPAHDSVS